MTHPRNWTSAQRREAFLAGRPQEIRPLTYDEMYRLRAALGVGRNRIEVRGKTFTIPNVELTAIPEEYRKGSL